MGKSKTTVGVKFTKDGPSVPVELLQSLEDGDLVVFCGAGISRYLGLPGFKGLVTELCLKLNRHMLADEQESFDAGAFDLTLGLIENRIGKDILRPAICGVLAVKKESDLSTHHALLQLATTKHGQVRLVTTNFDRAFELAQSSCVYDYAPYLPPPDNAWNSVVHLHGGLGNSRDPGGESLVFTSADFGRAYITEAWASRFLSELFRRAGAILFVGYSVSDPAVRYIVDAFAADRSDQNTRIAKAYLLLGGGENSQTWNSRGIEAIVYDSRDDHRLLHETLRNCAKRYRSGFFDRDSIVLEYAPQSPLSGLDSESISQITWALNDGSGHAARRFAGLDPPPPIEWLDTFEANGLLKIGPEFTPYGDAFPPVTLVPTSQLILPLGPTAHALCKWLCEHLAERRLIQWVIKNGAHLHPSLGERIRERLGAKNRPPIPEGPRLLWEFLSAENSPIFSPRVGHEVLTQQETMVSQSWNRLLRDIILTWLAPKIRLTEPFLWPSDTIDQASATSYADVELTPAAGEWSWSLADRLLGRPDVIDIAPDLLGDLTNHLEKGLSYLNLLGRANDDRDGTYSSLPSVDDHPQNDRLHHWPVYVHLIREAWTKISATDPARAREEVGRWMRIRFPMFRRLVLWSAGKPGGLAPSESITYLRAQPSSATWGLDTHRELLQFLSRIASSLSAEDADRLTDLIFAGPPRAQFVANLTEAQFREIAEAEIHIRLAKLRDGGLTLPTSAQQALRDILERHPAWDRPTNERDEFLVWSGDSGWSDPRQIAPRLNDYGSWSDESVLADLRENATSPETVARWRGLLSENPPRAVSILHALGNSGSFEPGTWSLALSYLTGEQSHADSVVLFGTFGLRLGREFISQHLHQLSGLVHLYGRAKNSERDEAFWTLWDLLLDPSAQAAPEDASDPAFTALNSAIGNLTESLLLKLGELNPSTYQDIPLSIRERLEALLNGSLPAHRLSRLLLARALAWLYRVRPELVLASFLPRFDWATSPEAALVWAGYLASPRITPELWAVLHPTFFATFSRSAELGRSETQFYSLFAFLLLREEFAIEVAEARLALATGSSKGRSQVAWYWWRQADSATDYGATLFRERLKYLLSEIWPLELNLREKGSSANLALLAACCGAAFPDAVATIVPLLTAIDTMSTFLWSFKDQDHTEKYPDVSLTLINAIVGQTIDVWSWPDLRKTLTRISVAQPALTADARFARLDALVRQFE